MKGSLHRANLKRRDLLKLGVATAAWGLLQACAPAAQPSPTSKPAATSAPQPAQTSAPAAATQAPVQAAKAKPFAGTTINASCFSIVFSEAVKEYLPEFEQLTGIKVNYDTQAFGVFNQRADLELSTKGSSFDAMNITMIYTGRWIGSGWFTPLDDYINDPNKTPADFDAKDFLPGNFKLMQDKSGKTYGFPWMHDASISCAARYDLVEKAGLKMPQTFDEITKLLDAVHNKENVKGFVIWNNHHFYWVPFLQGFGGNVFRNPPDDLMPTLDTPEAVQAVEFYANILRKYSPEGILSYTQDQYRTALLQGKANYSTGDPDVFSGMGDPKVSTVTKTANFDMFPAGPAGRKPATTAHGWGIPIGSKKKDAAWEFVKWVSSKEMHKRILLEKSFYPQTRVSIINSPEFKKMCNINGVDLADLYVRTLTEAGKGHMAYRTVPVFPMVGTVINKLIETVTTNQQSAKDACKEAQTSAMSELRKAGINL